eukprot:scaffold586_cov155-Amphora_coffeaeformis.AAC.2
MSMTNTTSPIHGDKSTKSALALPGQVPDFAAMLKERSRQRKDREDAAVASLRVQVQLRQSMGVLGRSVVLARRQVEARRFNFGKEHCGNSQNN